jgi:hypothetical protein
MRTEYHAIYLYDSCGYFNSAQLYLVAVSPSRTQFTSQIIIISIPHF